MDRSSQAFEITLLQGRPKRAVTKKRDSSAFAPNALLRYGLDSGNRRATALRYLEDVIAPRAIAFCHRLARRLARYR